MFRPLASKLVRHGTPPPGVHAQILADPDLAETLAGSPAAIDPDAWLGAWRRYPPGRRTSLAAAVPDVACLSAVLDDPDATGDERRRALTHADVDDETWARLVARPLPAEDAGIVRGSTRHPLRRLVELSRMDDLTNHDRAATTLAVFAQAAADPHVDDATIAADADATIARARQLAGGDQAAAIRRIGDHLTHVVWWRPTLAGRVAGDQLVSFAAAPVARDRSVHDRLIADACRALRGGDRFAVWLWGGALCQLLERPELTARTRQRIVAVLDDYFDPDAIDAGNVARDGFTTPGTRIEACHAHQHAAIIAATWRHQDLGARGANLFVLADIATVCSADNARAIITRFNRETTPVRPTVLADITRIILDRYPDLDPPTPDWWRVAVNDRIRDVKYPVVVPACTVIGPRGDTTPRPVGVRQWAKAVKTPITALGTDDWPIAARVLTTRFAGDPLCWQLAIALIDESREQTVGVFADAIVAVAAAGR